MGALSLLLLSLWLLIPGCGLIDDTPQHQSMITAADSPGGMVVIFILQVDRQRPTLENDAVLIANVIATADSEDFLQGFTTEGTEIFSLKLDSKRLKPSQFPLAKQRAIEDLKRFALKLFDNPPKEPFNNLAGALSLAMERFNHAGQYRRLMLVIFDSGLQHDRFFNFEGCYPEGPWFTHERSPFSVIRPNATQVRLEAIMIPEADDFVDSYHRTKIENWYIHLFKHIKDEPIGFTFDHQTATRLVLQGGPPLQSLPSAVNLSGDLTLIRVSPVSTEER